jgi:acyl-coenzyme A thioesterase 9
MENFDSLAGSVAYKHMLGPSVKTVGSIEDRGFYIVTASVDRCVPVFDFGFEIIQILILPSLDMLSPLNPKRDLRLSGLVIYTGRSSMEVVLKMESIGGGQPDEPVMIGMFLLPTIFPPFLISSLSRSLLHGLPECKD